MYEWYEKYSEFERRPTACSFDKPMILFLGLTLQEFIVGVSVFLAMVMSWGSVLAIPAGIVCSMLLKAFRKRLPVKFLHHGGWALGLQRLDPMPSLFKKHQNPTFGP